MAATGWRAGAATLPLTVQRGTPLAGYAARTGHATQTQLPLTITALILSAGDEDLVIVAADLIGVDEELVELIADHAGISRRNLLVAASHTHSGPAGILSRLHPAEPDASDPTARGRCVAICQMAIARARERLQPATVDIGRAPATGLAANRNDPDGPFDPTVTVVAARALDGIPIGVIVHWACHPTILGAESRLVSAEFPGAMRRALAQELGTPDLPVLYLNGAAGDVSTRFTRQSQTVDEVERVGQGVATAAVEALATAEPLRPSISHDSITVELASRSRDEIEAVLRRAAEIESNGSEAANSRIAETRAQGAGLLEKLAVAGLSEREWRIRLDGWRLGDQPVVVVPGELFASLGQRIAASTDPPALVTGYANGYVGYLADRAAYETGTYEALASPFAAGAAETVAEAAAALVSAERSRDR